MIDCRHWSRCGVKSGGCCALGIAGGRPSLGVCRACDQRSPRGPGLPAKLHAAAAGAARAATTPTPADTQEHRWAQCRACELLTPCLTGLHCCGKILTGKARTPANPGCGCVLEIKIRDPKAACPLDPPRWGPA